MATVGVVGGKTIKTVVVNGSTNGNNTLVAAVTGKQIAILGLALMAAGDVTATIQDGAGGTALIGPFDLSAAGYHFILPVAPLYAPWAIGTAATLLNMALNAGVQVGGVLVYAEV